MTRCVPILLICSLLLAAPLYGAQDDMQEKIKQLEQQIQELKALKAKQDVAKKKTDQCMTAVGQEKFCGCIGTNLPADVTFEQYIHTMLTPKEELGYTTMTPEQQKKVDDTLATRGKCVSRGLFD